MCRCNRARRSIQAPQWQHLDPYCKAPGHPKGVPKLPNEPCPQQVKCWSIKCEKATHARPISTQKRLHNRRLRPPTLAR
jgi:hypothetical protein